MIDRTARPTLEEIIEPDLLICDPHHHLWDFPDNRYLVDEFLDDVEGGHKVAKTVYVECRHMWRPDGPEAMRPVGETAYVDRLTVQRRTDAGSVRVAAGIVGFADLALGAAVEPVLSAHLGASDRFCGIRHMSAWDASERIHNAQTNPPRDLLRSSKFREGFACLSALNLSFDAWVYHPQIPEVTDLARAFPDTTIVLNHIGGPLGIGPYADRREEVFALWRSHITELARSPNVYVKLGGLTMSLSGFGWHKRESPPDSGELAKAMSPYYRTCIELFGPQRCMFESNFPVDRVSCSYTVLWNAFKRLSRNFSDAERAALFHDTAVSVYRLDD
jgi:predicted TIM-barrel fold metal-dependent hydrolase